MNISFLSSPLSKHIMLTYLISHWLSVAAMARVNVRRRSLAPTATCVKQARLHSRSTQLVELDCLKKIVSLCFLSLSLSCLVSLVSCLSLSPTPSVQRWLCWLSVQRSRLLRRRRVVRYVESRLSAQAQCFDGVTSQYSIDCRLMVDHGCARRNRCW